MLQHTANLSLQHMSDRLGRALECVSASFITFSLITAAEIFVGVDTVTINYCQIVIGELDNPMFTGMCPNILFVKCLIVK